MLTVTDVAKRAHAAAVDPLLTDMVLPGVLRGWDVAKRITAVRPEVRVPFMSDCTGNGIVRHGRLDPGVQLISKPFKRDQLARKVAEVLRMGEAGQAATNITLPESRRIDQASIDVKRCENVQLRTLGCPGVEVTDAEHPRPQLPCCSAGPASVMRASMEPGVQAAWGESERLRELQALQILDTPRERGFDRLVCIAAQVCRMPVAAVSLLDADRQWSKAVIGPGFSGLPRSEAFCAHALHDTAPLIVTDMRADARFQHHPLVAGPPGLRFYAGVPLAAPGGALIGTLCVLDMLPRILTEMQEWVLTTLAGEVSALIAARNPPMDGEGVVYSPWLDS